MSEAKPILREVETAWGVLPLRGPAAGRGSVRPVVLGITGFFAGDNDLAGLPAVLDIYGEGHVLTLTGARSRGGWSLAELAAGVDELIATQFPSRRVVVFGVSIGANVGLALRAPNVRRIVAVEPILATEKLWPVADEIAARLADLPQGDDRRRLWSELFGIGQGPPQALGYGALLAGLETPVDVLLGDVPLMPPRRLAHYPSLVDEPERRRLAAHPRVRLHVAPGVGHNIQGRTPKPAIDLLLEACRRASADHAYDPARLDEALFEATPLTARRIAYLGPDGEVFAAACRGRNPQATVEVASAAAGPNPGVDVLALGGPPDPAILTALVAQLAPDGLVVARWPGAAFDDEVRETIRAEGLRPPKPGDWAAPGVVRLTRAKAAAPQRLRVQFEALAPLLMDIRTRLPAQALASLPELAVDYRVKQAGLPQLSRDTPKVLLLQRSARMDAASWLAFLPDLILDDWVVVLEYDDHPHVVAEFHGRAPTGDALDRFGFVHAVQTTTPALEAAFRACNPEVALFPNAVFELPPFPEGPLRRRVFYGGVLRGEFAVEVAASLSPFVERFPDVEFVVIGDARVFEALPGRSKVLHDYMSYEAYLALMATCGVSLSPLEPRPLRETKSDAKFLDASRAGVLTIASPTVYDRAIETGVNGYLVGDMAGWSQRLIETFGDEAASLAIARRAWEQVRDGRMFAHQAGRWSAWYASLWTRRAELTEALYARLPGLREAVEAKRRERG